MSFRLCHVIRHNVSCSELWGRALLSVMEEILWITEAVFVGAQVILAHLELLDWMDSLDSLVLVETEDRPEQLDSQVWKYQCSLVFVIILCTFRVVCNTAYIKLLYKPLATSGMFYKLLLLIHISFLSHIPVEIEYSSLWPLDSHSRQFIILITSTLIFCLSFTLSLQAENLPFPQILPTVHFSPLTGLLSRTRTIFQIICLSVFVVIFVCYFSLFLISILN